MGFSRFYFLLEQKPVFESQTVAIIHKMEGANGKTGTQTTYCKMSRKPTHISSVAICLSIASMVMTILCCTALFLLWSKYETAIFELESKVKKCQQPLEVADKLLRHGNSSTKRLIRPIFISMLNFLLSLNILKVVCLFLNYFDSTKGLLSPESKGICSNVR